MIKNLLLIAISFISTICFGQTGKTQVVRLNATANANGSITLKWPQESWTGTWDVYRKKLGDASWGTMLSRVTGSLNTYTDNTTKIGESYEYLVTKISGTTTSALGYLYSGNKYTEQPAMGGICLLVDSAYRIALSKEIVRLKDQLHR